MRHLSQLQRDRVGKSGSVSVSVSGSGSGSGSGSRVVSTGKLAIVFVLGLLLGWLGGTSLTAHQGLFVTGAPRPNPDFPPQTCSCTTIQAQIGRQSKTQHSVVDDDDDGWHSISVFRGNQTEVTRDGTQEWTWTGQARQDEVVYTLLRNRTKGYFVDLAANDATLLSNTYRLETKLGWKGLCIEANPMYWYNLTHFRPNCQIVGAVVGTQKNQAVHFYHAAGDHGGIIGFDNGAKFQSKSQLEFTTTLEEIFRRHQVPSTIDYLSLDVEGAEAYIMSNFPLAEYQIRLLTVERPNDELRSLLESHGYRLIQRLSRWGETLWAHRDIYDQLDLSRLDDFHGKKQYFAEKARQEAAAVKQASIDANEPSRS